MSIQTKILSLYLATTLASLSKPAAAQSQRRPNIIVILADDLGYSDLGSYGSEIKTPNLDRLAAEGLRLQQFYNNSICAPSRASLLTGQYQHKAGVGYFSQDLGLPAYQGFINNSSLTMAEVLRQGGYQTLMSGKWHVSGKGQSFPWQRGFDHSFLSENGSYFDQGGLAGERGQPYMLDGQPELHEPGTYYQTDLITSKALGFLKTRADKKPFFLYLAYTAPHWPLHALPEDIARYKGKYDGGWDKLREARLARQRDLGLISAGLQASEKDDDIYDWDRLSYDQRKAWAAKMEVFAAMVDRLDKNIGILLKQLKDSGEDKNTMIVFMSDNGAPAEDLVKWFGGALRNEGPVGSAGSFESQSKNWSWASNTPFRAFKDYMYEGGINTPFIAWFPGKIAAGRVARGAGHIIDIAPTVYDLAGVKYPSSYKKTKSNPLAGKSLMPLLIGKSDTVTRDAPLFWERAGNRAVREGKWKLLSTWPSYAWELYDLSVDPTERQNVAAAHHDVVSRLSQKYFVWAAQTGVVDFGKLETKEPPMMKQFRKSKTIELVAPSNGL